MGPSVRPSIVHCALLDLSWSCTVDGGGPTCLAGCVQQAIQLLRQVVHKNSAATPAPAGAVSLLGSTYQQSQYGSAREAGRDLLQSVRDTDVYARLSLAVLDEDRERLRTAVDELDVATKRAVVQELIVLDVDGPLPGAPLLYNVRSIAARGHAWLMLQSAWALTDNWLPLIVHERRRGLELLRQAVAVQHAEAQYLMGALYLHDGLAKRVGLPLVQQSADQGHPGAFSELWMWHDSQSATADKNAAILWEKKWRQAKFEVEQAMKLEPASSSSLARADG